MEEGEVGGKELKNNTWAALCVGTKYIFAEYKFSNSFISS